MLNEESKKKIIDKLPKYTAIPRIDSYLNNKKV